MKIGNTSTGAYVLLLLVSAIAYLAILYAIGG
jgi:hypothetical protein